MRSLAITPVLVALALSACGSESSQPGASRDAETRPGANTPVTPTAGRTGEATVAAAGQPVRRLARGGKIDAREDRRRSLEREGVGAGAACANTELVPTTDNLELVTAATLCLLNSERADAGLGPLTHQPTLAEAARKHALDMVALQFFAHVTPDGRDIVDRVRAAGYLGGDAAWTVGENLAWGSGPLSTPRSIMQAWMDSPGHKANVLRPDYRDVGMGVVLGIPRSTSGIGATYAHAFGTVAGTSGPGSTTSTTTPSSTSGNVAGRRTTRTSSRKSRFARSCRARGKSRKARAAARRCKARRASRRR